MSERSLLLALPRSTQTSAEAVSDPQPAQQRVWVRHPSSLATHCQPVVGREGARWSAVIRDFSRGGIRLVLARQLEPGTLLNVELPASSTSVLAYVVHAKRLPDGQWATGCHFTRELSDDDWQALTGAPVQADSINQRQGARYRCAARASCQRVLGEDEVWAARVVDLSPGGVRLEVDREVETGTLFHVELFPAEGESVCTMLACVVHVTLGPGGERLVGCNFIRQLSEENLHALLAS